MIADMLRIYGEEVAPGMKSARLIAYHIANLLKWWGDKTAAQITMRTCKEFCATRPPQGAIADLKVLKASTTYWHRSEYGPLNFQPVFWLPKANPPKDRWLTKREAARLLKAAKPYLHLRRMILLGLHTGSRPGVILALRWDQIDLKAGVIRRVARR
jgi:integrase